jgi:hypothetical protein
MRNLNNQERVPFKDKAPEQRGRRDLEMVSEDYKKKSYSFGI